MNDNHQPQEGYSAAYDKLTTAEAAIHQAKEQLRLSWLHGEADSLAYHKLASTLNQADESIRAVVSWGSRSYIL